MTLPLRQEGAGRGLRPFAGHLATISYAIHLATLHTALAYRLACDQCSISRSVGSARSDGCQFQSAAVYTPELVLWCEGAQPYRLTPGVGKMQGRDKGRGGGGERQLSVSVREQFTPELGLWCPGAHIALRQEWGGCRGRSATHTGTVSRPTSIHRTTHAFK